MKLSKSLAATLALLLAAQNLGQPLAVFADGDDLAVEVSSVENVSDDSSAPENKSAVVDHSDESNITPLTEVGDNGSDDNAAEGNISEAGEAENLGQPEENVPDSPANDESQGGTEDGNNSSESENGNLENDSEKPGTETLVDEEPDFSAMRTTGTYQPDELNIVGEAEEKPDLPTVNFGSIEGQNLELNQDGFEFLYAAVGDTKIDDVRCFDEKNQVWIHPVDGDARALNADEKIVFTYKYTPPAKEDKAFLTIYIYKEGASLPYEVKQEEVSYGPQTVQIPQAEGYTTYLADDEGHQTGDEELTSLDLVIDGDKDIYLVQVPGTAEYRVWHNYPDKPDEYEVKTGKVGDLTEVEARTDGRKYSALYPAQSAIQPDGSTVVEIEYVVVDYVLNFDSDGGSFVDPIQFTADQTIKLGSYKPVKEGYAFAGWSLDGENKIETFSIDNIQAKQTKGTVKALWTPSLVNYTVRIWKQSVNDKPGLLDGQKTYDYVDSRNEKAVTGSTVSPDGGTPDKGFRFNSENSTCKTVNADGSTIVDVKYDRINVSVTLDYGDSKLNRTTVGLFGAPFTDENGNSLWDSNYTWNRRNGGALLLTTYDLDTAGYSTDKTVLTRDEGSLKAGDWKITFTKKGTKADYQIAYYNEQYDGSYRLVETISCSQNNFNVYEKYAGYELYRYSAESSGSFTDASFWDRSGKSVSEADRLSISSKTPTKVASRLKKYSIQYDSWNSIIKTVKDVKFTTPLSEVEGSLDYVPVPPANKGYYKFAGWYLDPAFKTPATADVTVPNGNLILYAKWVPEVFTATVHPKGAESDETYEIENIEGGSRIESIETPVNPGYIFKGWFLDAEYTQPYDLNKVIEGNIDIYAKWTPQDVMDVTIRHIDDSKAEDDPERILFEDHSVSARVGSTLVVPAKTFDGLIPNSAFVSYEIKRGQDNVIEVHYHRVENKFYKVQYIDKETSQVVYDGPAASNNRREEFTVKAEIPEDFYYYQLASGEQSVKRVSSADLSSNENDPSSIIFYVSRKKVPLTFDVYAEGLSHEYDGLDHDMPEGTTTLEGCYVYYSIDNGENWSVNTPSAKNVSDTKEVLVKAADPEGNYADSEVVPATLVITPKNIQVEAETVSRPYDGTTLTGGAKANGLVGDETVSIMTSGSITKPGSTVNKYEGIDWENSTALEENYTVSPSDGTLTITKADASFNPILMDNDSAVYNGAMQTTSKDAFNGKEGTVYYYSADQGENKTWSEGKPEFKDAGTYTVFVKGEHECYEDAYTEASFTISKAKLTATADSASQVYNGSPLTAPGGKIEGLVGGEKAEAVSEGSIVNVGKAANNIKQIVWDEESGTKASNYEVENVPGILEITPADSEGLGLTFTDRTVTYNSKPQSLVPASAIPGTTIEYSTDGENWSAELPSFTDVRNDGYQVDARAVNPNYKTAQASAVLMITPAEIKVSTSTASKVYDGKELTAPGTITGVQENDQVELQVVGTITDAGSTQNTYKLVWGDTKESNYTVSDSVGTLTVTQAAGTITVNDGDAELGANGISRKYNGQTSTVSASAKNSDGTAIEDVEFTYFVNGEPVDEATFKDASEAEVTVAASHNNYKFDDVVVPVSITKREVTLRSDNITKTYDGSALINDHAAHPIHIEGADGFVEGEGLESVEFTASVTNVAEKNVANEFEYTLNDSTKASNYEISPVYGDLMITRRPVNLQSKTASKIYDGTELADHTVTETAGSMGFVEGELKEYVFAEAATQTEVGTAVNEFKVVLNDGFSFSNYDITKSYGNLTVRNSGGVIIADPGTTASMEGQSVSKVYDGQPVLLTFTAQNEDDVVLETDYDFVVNGQKVSELPDMTDAGEWEITATAKNPNLKDENDQPLTAAVTVTVTPRPYTVTTGSASQTYNGSPLTNSEIEVNNLVKGEATTAAAVGSIVNTGSVQNAYSLEFDQNAKASNYVLEDENLGTLTVTQRKVTLRSADDGKVYDGYALGNENVFVTGEGFVEGETPSYEFGPETKPVDAGEYTNAFKPVFRDQQTEDNYDITLEFGKLVIRKAEPTFEVTADGNVLDAKGFHKIYDGETVTLSGTVKNQEGKPIEGQLVYIVTNTANPDESETLNTKPQFLDAGQWSVTVKATNSNVTDTVKTVAVTIDRAPLVIKADSLTGEYNGEIFTASGTEVAGLIKNEQISAAAVGSRKDAGETVNVVDVDNINWKSAKASNYSVHAENGLIKVTPRPITATAGTSSKVYDGTPLSAGGTITNLVNGETAEVITEGSQTDAGTSVNKAVGINWGTAKEDNYSVEYRNGTLVVVKAPASENPIDFKDQTVEYNGSEQSLEPAKAAQEGTELLYTTDPENGEWTEEMPAFRNAGTYTVYVKGSNDNFETSESKAVLTVVPREITLSSGSATKPYDGAPLVHEYVEVTSGEFVEGEEPFFHDFHNELVEPGTADNKFSYSFASKTKARSMNAVEDEDLVEQNYEITQEFGKLEVVKASSALHELALEDKKVTYNGKDQSLDPATHSIDEANIEYSVDGEEWSAEMPAYKHVGQYTIYVRANHKFYEDADTEAVLEIVPAELKVVTESASKEYDGTALTAPGNLEGLAEGDEVTLIVTGSQKEVGTSSNTYEIVFVDELNKDDYVVVEELGTLTVTEKAAAPAAPKAPTPAPAAPKKETGTKTDAGTGLGLWAALFGTSGISLGAVLGKKRKDKKDRK